MLNIKMSCLKTKIIKDQNTQHFVLKLIILLALELTLLSAVQDSKQIQQKG